MNTIKTTGAQSEVHDGVDDIDGTCRKETY